MATTQNTYTGNGSNKLFSITFPYLETSDIDVYLNNVLQTITTQYSFANATTIEFVTAPPNGATVKIDRTTDDSELPATFFPGSSIKAADLNADFDQTLYVVQEINNKAVKLDDPLYVNKTYIDAADATKVNKSGDTMSGNLAMSGNLVTGLGTPSSDADSATKKYVDDRYGQLSIPGVTRWRKTATAGQTTFSGAGEYGGTLAYSSSRETVYVNGALQQRNVDYTANNGTSIVFTPALLLGDVVEVHCVNNAAGVTTDQASGIYWLQSGTGALTRTVDSKLKDVVSVKDFGAVCNGVTNDATAVAAANTAAAGRPLLFPGVTHIGSPVTITCPIVDTNQQLFTANSQITIDNKLYVRPDWWGDVENTINYATNALPAGGGTVKLANRIYKSNNHAYTFGSTNTTQYLSKDNVLYEGEKMPRLADDCRSLVGGTIIQDMIFAYANNIEFRNLGIDSGKTYIDAKYGGPPPYGAGEGLILSYPDNATKNSSALRRNARLHNIIGLSYSPSALTHAVIVGEGYQNVTCTGEIVGCYGVHGIVIKCSNVKAEQFTSYCNNFEGVIIKSDAQATAVSYNIQIGKIFVDANGPDGWTPYATATTGNGLYLHCSGNNIDGVQIGSLISTGYPVGITSAFGGAYTLSNVQIDTARIDCSSIAGSVGIILASTGSQVIQFCQFGNVHIRNCGIGIAAQYVNAGFVTSFSNVDATNVSDVVLQIGDTAYVNISAIHGRAVTNAIARITATPKLLFGQVFRDQAGCPMFHSGSGGLVPTLKNGWTQFSGNDTFRVELEGGRVHMRGLILPGSSNNFTQLPAWAWPAETKRFLGQAYNGITVVAAPITVGTDGNVYVNEVAGGTANCSSWLSLAGCSWTGQA